MNLVERLRKWCQWQRVQGTTDNNGYPYHKHVPDCEICQAADRIEELEAESGRRMNIITAQQKEIGRLTDAIRTTDNVHALRNLLVREVNG